MLISYRPSGSDDAAVISDIFKAHGTCTIKLEPGIYKLGSPIVQTHAGSEIEGYGEATVLRKFHREPAFVCRAHDLSHRRFMLECHEQPGVGMLFDSALRGCVTDNVRFREFDIAIEVENGITRWDCRRCVFNRSRSAGIRIRNDASPDTGNFHVSDCVFSDDRSLPGACGIQYCSSGGLWVEGCSFLGLGFGVKTTMLSKGTVGTADLFIYHNSFELQRQCAVQINEMDVPGFSAIHVDHNHFMCIADSEGWRGIEVAWPRVHGITLIGNDFQLGANRAKAILARTGTAIHAPGNIATVSWAAVGIRSDVFDRKGNEDHVDFGDSILRKVQ